MAKSWKPPVVESSFDNQRGKAQVRVGTAKGKPVAEIKFFDSGEKYLFKGKDVPEALSTGVWNVSINSDNNEIFGFSPWDGNYKVKVDKFTKGSGEDENNPAPKEYKYTYNDKEIREERFTILLRVVEGKRSGVLVPLTLPFRFKKAEWEGHEVIGFPSTKGKTKLLIEVLDLSGAWEQGPMKYKDNPLPDLQKRILRAEKTFNIVIKDGWVDTVFATFEATEDLDWSEDENEAIVSEEEGDAALERIDEVGFEVEEELPWDQEE